MTSTLLCKRENILVKPSLDSQSPAGPTFPLLPPEVLEAVYKNSRGSQEHHFKTPYLVDKYSTIN